MRTLTAIILMLAMGLGTPLALAFPGCCCSHHEAGEPEAVAVAAESAAPSCCSLNNERDHQPAAPATQPTNDHRPAEPVGNCDCPPLCCASVTAPALTGAPTITVVWGDAPSIAADAPPAGQGRLSAIDLMRPPRA